MVHSGTWDNGVIIIRIRCIAQRKTGRNKETPTLELEDSNCRVLESGAEVLSQLKWLLVGLLLMMYILYSQIKHYGAIIQKSKNRKESRDDITENDDNYCHVFIVGRMQ